MIRINRIAVRWGYLRPLRPGLVEPRAHACFNGGQTSGRQDTKATAKTQEAEEAGLT
jgi:hypothetical protein